MPVSTSTASLPSHPTSSTLIWIFGLLVVIPLCIAALSFDIVHPHLPEWLAHPGTWMATLGAPGILIGLLVKQHQHAPLNQAEPTIASADQQPDRKQDEIAAEKAILAILDQMAEGEFAETPTLDGLPAHWLRVGEALLRTHNAVRHAQGNLEQTLDAALRHAENVSPDATQRGSYGRSAMKLGLLLQAGSAPGALQQRLDLAIASGDFSAAPSHATHMDDALTHSAERLFAMIDAALADISRMAEALSQGKLSETISADYPGCLGSACQGMNKAVLNLRETMGRIDAVVDTVSGAARQIAVGNDTLASRAQEQAANLEETASSMEQINAVIQQNDESTANVLKFVDQASGMAEQSTVQMEETSRTISQLADGSKRIADIVGVIDSIAFQTNILALNAAVEAARAGEHGRGFAVVASEVRQLSLRSSEAAQDIRRLIATSAQQTKATIDRVDQQSRTMSELIGTIRQINGHMRDIRSASHEQATGLGQVSQAIMRIDDATQQTSTLVDDSATNTRQLYGQARGLHHLLAEFDLGAAGERARQIHAEMPDIVQRAAARIAQAWEEAIRQKRLTEADLFDTDYQPLGNTEPPKFRTRFDQIADQFLPAIQEPLLQAGAHLSYAIACDQNGYVPTHNDRYCEALTGDIEYDRVHNRSKRLFSDPVGRRCGKHPLPYLLQTYRRDTGEIVHDISAPVFVNGRHWGGFRIGYKTALDI